MLFAAGWSAGVVYGMYSVTKGVDELRHLKPSNCTILDAQVDDDQDWVIHVNFTVPSSYHKPPNTTHVSLLDGTDPNTHYFVNQTLPCYVSTRNINTVSLSRQAVDGGTVFGIIVISIMCIPVLIGACALIFTFGMGLLRLLRAMFKLIVSLIGGVGSAVKIMVSRVPTRAASRPEGHNLPERTRTGGT
jgi:hypothetical protein